MATPAEVSKTWTVLAAMYPEYSRDMSEEVLTATLGLYQELLADIPAHVLSVAAKQHMASSKWFPKPSELRDLAAKLMTPAIAERTPDEAWGLVKRAVAGYYPYADRCEAPAIEDPIAAAVVRDMGGLHYLFASDNEISDRKQFIDAYRMRQERQRQDALLLPAAREMKALNSGDGSGIPAQLPGRVGDVIKQLADKRSVDA